MNSTQVQLAVLADQAELGFVEGPELAVGLDSRMVAQDRLVVVVVAALHPWARRRWIDAAEPAATRLVQREPASGTRTALERALADHCALSAQP